jgi:hypothetical protein
MLRALTFTSMVLVATVVSVLLHETGHCLLYWLQGIPAARSLVKEFPLRDVTVLEYAIGSTGGPLASLALLGTCLWLYRRKANDTRWSMALSAFILANLFYFILRGLISLVKRRGGELGDMASLIGLSYGSVVLVYAVISIVALYAWMKLAGIRLSPRAAGSFVALLIGYLFFIVGLETIDQRLFWGKFPAIQIDDGRTYS